MLILVLILCLATSLYVALRRKDSLSLYLLGMSVCNLVMFAGIIVYIAAIGGTAAQPPELPERLAPPAPKAFPCGLQTDSG